MENQYRNSSKYPKILTRFALVVQPKVNGSMSKNSVREVAELYPFFEFIPLLRSLISKDTEII